MPWRIRNNDIWPVKDHAAADGVVGIDEIRIQVGVQESGRSLDGSLGFRVTNARKNVRRKFVLITPYVLRITSTQNPGEPSRFVYVPVISGGERGIHIHKQWFELEIEIYRN
jgi:hypothetical protein